MPDAPPHSAGQPRCRLARAELTLAEKDPALARRELDRPRPASADGQREGVIARVWRVRARALATLGRTAEAIATVNAARDEAAARETASILYRLHADAAAFHRAGGRRAEAAHAASTARAMIAEAAQGAPKGQLSATFLRRARPLR